MRRDDDYEDEYDDDRPRRRKKKSNHTTVIIVLLAVIAAVVVGSAGLVALFVVGVTAEQQAKEQKAKALPTRDEMRAKLAGKTMDQVREMLGTPKKTDDNDADRPSWRYEEMTRDPITGKTDSYMWIYFRRGVVSEVHF